jgi:hypothetical protein
MQNNNSSSTGIDFFGSLTLLFIGLKLGNVINWSWFWVLSPTIIPFILALVIILIILFLDNAD